MRRSSIVAGLAWAVSLLAPPGADGAAENLVFASDRDGTYDIWRMNPDGTGQTKVGGSPTAHETMPSVSPDGNTIVFIRGYNGGCCGEGAIWTMQADGTGETFITDFGQDPVWSPDGTKIAFGVPGHGGRGDGIWKMNADGSGQTPLATPSRDHIEPTWSPDGLKIAFSVSFGYAVQEEGIWRVNADGTGLTQLTASIDDSGADRHPDWSPTGSQLVFERLGGLWLMNPDGMGQTQLPASGRTPAWKPDAAKIIFSSSRDGNDEIYTMDPDGSAQTRLTSNTASDIDPDWQVIGASGADLLASITDAPDPIPAGGRLHYIASAKNLVGPDDATGVVLTVTLDPNAFVVSAAPTQGSCSQASNVVTCNFGSVPQGTSADVDIAIEPRFPTPISASAGVSGNETDPVPGNNTASTTTTITSGGQPRPKGATPLRASLALAYKSCGPGEENEQHGGPLNVLSCSPPTQSSSYLTVGTLDANGQAAGFIGSVRFDVIEGDTNPNNGDQADVALHAALTDVRNKPSLTDYTGELEGQTTVRITDHDNSAGYFAAATVQDMPLGYTIPCTATGGGAGSTCTLDTTVDALTGGGVKELKRSIWQLDRVRVTDGGADGSVSTLPNTMFATQGVFVP